MLIPLYLYEKKILSRPIFYFSACIAKHRDAYAAHLQPLSESHGPWNHWIVFFLEALIEQARENASNARSINELYESLKSRIIEATHSKYAVALLDALFVRPILRSSELEVHAGLPSKPMIMSMLAKLKQEGILKVLREGSGRRAQVLALADLINLCEGATLL
jgi:Fic family protein